MPVEGQGGVTLSYVCPHCHIRLKTTSGGSRRGTVRAARKGRGSVTGAAGAGQYNWGDPNRVLVKQDRTKPQRGEGISGRHAIPGPGLEPHVCPQIGGQFAIWRELHSGHDLPRFAGPRQVEKYERNEEDKQATRTTTRPASAEDRKPGMGSIGIAEQALAEPSSGVD